MEEKVKVSIEISRDDFYGILAIMSMTSPEIANMNRDELWQKALNSPIDITTVYENVEQDKLAQLKFIITTIAIGCIAKTL